MSALKVARIALVAFIALWAITLIVWRFAGGAGAEFAILVGGVIAPIGMVISAVACLFLQVRSKRHAR